MTPRARGLAKLAALCVLLAAAAYAVRASPARGMFTLAGAGRLIASLRGAPWAPVAFVATYALAATLDFSGLVLTLAGGALFGFWRGAVFNLLGANLGASGAFWLARALGREGLRALLGERLARLDRIAEQAGFLWLLRLRLIPIVPFNLLNFACGLTALPWRAYAAATALGVVPATLVYTFFADAVLSGSHATREGAYLRVLIAGALVALLSFAPSVLRKRGIARRASQGVRPP